jgi:hypothetical protein
MVENTTRPAEGRGPAVAKATQEIERAWTMNDPQRLEDISNIRDAMRQISLESAAIVEFLDARTEDEHLDGRTEAEDVRSVLELIQSLTLEVSEALDAYQGRNP